jgi:hypothetical protein
MLKKSYANHIRIDTVGLDRIVQDHVSQGRTVQDHVSQGRSNINDDRIRCRGCQRTRKDLNNLI